MDPPANPALEFVVPRRGGALRPRPTHRSRASRAANAATTTAAPSHSSSVASALLASSAAAAAAAAAEAEADAADISSTAIDEEDRGGSQARGALYALRRARPEHVLSELHFPPTASAPSAHAASHSPRTVPKPPAHASAPLSHGSHPSSLSPSPSRPRSTERKQTMGVASSPLQRQHQQRGLARNDHLTRPSSTGATAATAHHSSESDLARRPRSQQQQDQRDEEDEERAPQPEESEPEPRVGFGPPQEDVMDLYFFLIDERCPIFPRSDAAVAAVAAATTAAASASASRLGLGIGSRGREERRDNLAHMLQRSALHAAEAERVDPAGMAGAGGEDPASDEQRHRCHWLPAQPAASAPAPSSTASFAARCGIDLDHLVALREAAGGSVRHALGYLQQLVPRALAGGSSGSGSGGGGAPLVHFDPFQHMDDLIRCVRSMRQRDRSAGVAPPCFVPPGSAAAAAAGGGEEASEGGGTFAALYRRGADQSFPLPPPPPAPRLLHPDPHGWSLSPSQARAEARDVRAVAKELLQF